MLSKVADAEGVEVRDAEVDAEVAQGPSCGGRPAPDLLLRVRAGPIFIRSTLRRSRVVERLIDEWLAAHPDHPPLPHLEDVAGAPSAPRVPRRTPPSAPPTRTVFDDGDCQVVDEPAAAS